MRFRMHLRNAEKRFSAEKTGGVQPLVKLCREEIVREVKCAGKYEFFTDDRVADCGALAGGGEANEGAYWRSH